MTLCVLYGMSPERDAHCPLSPSLSESGCGTVRREREVAL